MSGASATNIKAVATMATEECDGELHLFLTSLRQFHSQLPVFVATTPGLLAKSHSIAAFREDPHIYWLPFISRDRYGKQLDRRHMEATRGVFYPTLHCDFMMEKATVMGHALEALEAGLTGTPYTSCNVLFMDCDLVLFNELPLVPKCARVGVSPHNIRSADEALFGRYNGGWFFVADPLALHKWRVHTQNSRFHDQASIEDVVESYGGAMSEAVHTFPLQCNYGYWRMFQAGSHAKTGDVTCPPEKMPVASAGFSDPTLVPAALREVQHFTITAPEAPRIMYRNAPLQSIHTHLLMKQLEAGSRAMPLFNSLLRKWINACATGGNLQYRAIAACLR